MEKVNCRESNLGHTSSEECLQPILVLQKCETVDIFSKFLQPTFGTAKKIIGTRNSTRLDTSFPK